MKPIQSRSSPVEAGYRPLVVRLVPALSALVLAAVPFVADWAAAAPLPADPVEELRHVLRQDRGLDWGLRAENAAGLAYRRQRLNQVAARIRNLGDLQRALLLADWPDVSEARGGGWAEVDREVLRDLQKRFDEGVHAALDRGDATAKIAVANLIGETAAGARRNDRNRLEATKGMPGMGAGKRGAPTPGHLFLRYQMRDLAPHLVRLTASPDDSIRIAAARALGRIEPNPTIAVPALRALLNPDVSVPVQRAAASALNDMVTVVVDLAKERQDPFGLIERTRDNPRRGEPLDTMETVAPALAGTLDDQDGEVRRLAAEGFRRITFHLADSIPRPAGELPSPGRPLDEEERKRLIDDPQLQVAREVIDITQPLLKKLEGLSGTLDRAAADPLLGVRLEVRRALEDILLAAHGLGRLQATLDRLQGPAKRPAPPQPGPGLSLLPPRPGAMPAAARAPLTEAGRSVQVLSAEEWGKGRADLAQPVREPLTPTLLPVPGQAPAPLVLQTNPPLAATLEAPQVRPVSATVPASNPPPLAATLGAPVKTLPETKFRDGWQGGKVPARQVSAVSVPSAQPVRPARPGRAVFAETRQGEVRLTAARMEQAPELAPPPRSLTTVADRIRTAMVNGLRDPDVRVRLASLDVLESLGEAAAPAIPELVRALCDPNHFVRWAAARILGELAPHGAAEAIPALMRMLNEREDLSARIAATVAIGQFGLKGAAEPAQAVDLLSRVLHHGDATFRLAVLGAIEAIGTDATPALSSVARALADSDPRVRAEAARVLGRFGSIAREALPALREVALRDPDDNVRRAASEAVLAIDRQR
jgi:HEAT repeat protein